MGGQEPHVCCGHLRPKPPEGAAQWRDHIRPALTWLRTLRRRKKNLDRARRSKLPNDHRNGARHVQRRGLNPAHPANHDPAGRETRSPTGVGGAGSVAHEMWGQRLGTRTTCAKGKGHVTGGKKGATQEKSVELLGVKRTAATASPGD